MTAEREREKEREREREVCKGRPMMRFSPSLLFPLTLCLFSLKVNYLEIVKDYRGTKADN